MSHDEHGTRDQSNPPESGPEQQTARQNVRRRLLKAAGVAPVIYTLPSGGALARTSSSCLGDLDNVITEVNKEKKEVCNPGNSQGKANANVQACTNQGLETVETGSLKAGNQTYTLTGKDRNGLPVYTDDNNDTKQFILTEDQNLVAESCWSSMNLSATDAIDRFIK